MRECLERERERWRCLGGVEIWDDVVVNQPPPFAVLSTSNRGPRDEECQQAEIVPLSQELNKWNRYRHHFRNQTFEETGERKHTQALRRKQRRRAGVCS